MRAHTKIRTNRCVRALLSLALLAFLHTETIVPTVVFADQIEASNDSEPIVLNIEELPNAIQVHPKVISGGLPEDSKAFSELAKLGVRTIISVDGQTPDVAAAKKHGMKYVHLPHGYNGISAERTQELAKAVRDLPGPIYIHCHHGKHRSPAAASVACVGAGFLPSEAAVSFIRMAGTSPHYEGLYRSVRTCRRFNSIELDQLEVDFNAQAPIAPLVESMVSIEHRFSNLKQFQKVDWKNLKHHPDIEPAHEALLLKEHFRELSRFDQKEQTPDYLQLLKSSEIAAEHLEAELRSWKSSKEKQAPTTSLMNSMLLLEKNCQQCHQKYRDVSLIPALQR